MYENTHLEQKTVQDMVRDITLKLLLLRRAFDLLLKILILNYVCKIISI